MTLLCSTSQIILWLSQCSSFFPLQFPHSNSGMPWHHLAPGSLPPLTSYYLLIYLFSSCLSHLRIASHLLSYCMFIFLLKNTNSLKQEFCFVPRFAIWSMHICCRIHQARKSLPMVADVTHSLHLSVLYKWQYPSAITTTNDYCWNFVHLRSVWGLGWGVLLMMLHSRLG